MKILFINACVREESRTLCLAQAFLSRLQGDIQELDLQTLGLFPLTRETLALRETLAKEKAWEHPMFNLAREFAQADHIVIAAPYWDLGFPALLKLYLEDVTVAGITFSYAEGVPVGLCRAKKLTYFTTAGGKIFQDFGYSYVKTLAETFYGIDETECYFAENTDVLGVTNQTLFEMLDIQHKG